MAIEEQRLAPLWRVKQSTREGFHRTYFTETEDGDEIVIDFNNARQMVRIMLTLASEGGRQYLAVIKSGTILQERDVTVGRPADVNSKFYPVRNFIGAIPDESLRKAIGGCYGIPVRGPASKRGSARLIRIRKVNRWTQFLNRKRQRENRPGSPFQKILRRIPAEMAQGAMAGLIATGWLYNFMNLAQLACALGFFAIWSGAYDWLIRQKAPFLPRVAGLMLMSMYVVWTEFQYRLWGIFL